MGGNRANRVLGVAEPLGTVSNLAYVWAGWSLAAPEATTIGLRFTAPASAIVLAVLLATLGLASALYHATLTRHRWMRADERMIYLVLVGLIAFWLAERIQGSDAATFAILVAAFALGGWLWRKADDVEQMIAAPLLGIAALVLARDVVAAAVLVVAGVLYRGGRTIEQRSDAAWAAWLDDAAHAAWHLLTAWALYRLASGIT